MSVYTENGYVPTYLQYIWHVLLLSWMYTYMVQVISVCTFMCADWVNVFL